MSTTWPPSTRHQPGVDRRHQAGGDQRPAQIVDLRALDTGRPCLKRAMLADVARREGRLAGDADLAEARHRPRRHRQHQPRRRASHDR